MVEYRVTALYYRFRSTVETDRFDSAVAQSGSLGAWDYKLADGVLAARPTPISATATPRVDAGNRLRGALIESRGWCKRL